jgi:hypothetical protein
VSVLHGDHYRLPLPQSQHRGCGSQGAHTQGVSESNPKGTIVSIKSKVFAAAAALTVLGGVASAGALTATSSWAATPSCGPTCIDIFNKQFGTYQHPSFIADVFRQGQKVGQPLILFRQSNSDPAQDFTFANEGQVSDFFQADLVSSAFNLHYGCNWSINENQCTTNKAGQQFPDLYAFEIQYSPYGVDSGLCVGLASTAVSGEKVSLQPCGVTSKTIWAPDTLDSCPTNPLYSLEVQLINGSDTNFSHPFVLTYPSGGYPTDVPRPQLYVSNLTGFSQTGGTGNQAVCGGLAVTGPNTDQLFGALLGVPPGS